MIKREKAMKRYIKPQVQVVELHDEMPIICTSPGSANDSTPTNDNDNNLFSVGGYSDAWVEEGEDE